MKNALFFVIFTLTSWNCTAKEYTFFGGATFGGGKYERTLFGSSNSAMGDALYGINLGYHFNDTFSLEISRLTSTKDYSGGVTSAMISARTNGSVYFRGRGGWAKTSGKYLSTSFAIGAGVGLELSDNSTLELDYTLYEGSLQTATFNLNFHF